MRVEALDLAEFLDERKRGGEGFFVEHHHARAALELVGGEAGKGMVFNSKLIRAKHTHDAILYKPLDRVKSITKKMPKKRSFIHNKKFPACARCSGFLLKFY